MLLRILLMGIFGGKDINIYLGNDSLIYFLSAGSLLFFLSCLLLIWFASLEPFAFLKSGSMCCFCLMVASR